MSAEDQTFENRFHRIPDRHYGGGLLGTISMVYKHLPNYKRMTELYVRPPFPVIMERPTVGDVLRNLKMCDFVAFGALYGLGK